MVQRLTFDLPISRSLILLCAITLLLLSTLCDGRRRCRCQNGGRCSRGGLCRCKKGGGFFGDKCELPCIDIYNSCKNWKDQGRCTYKQGANKFFLENCPVSCRECVYNAETAPKGTPLAPVLRPLQAFLGTWQTETQKSFRYPVSFSSEAGYNETIEIKVAKLPAFDTPYLSFSSTAQSKGEDGDVQSDLGFIWLKPSKNDSTKLIGNMFTTNAGLTVIQEGILTRNVMKFTRTTYWQYLADGGVGNFELDVEVIRMFKLSLDKSRLVQIVIDKERYFYQKLYDKIQ